jgi:hypothetical protein
MVMAMVGGWGAIIWEPSLPWRGSQSKSSNIPFPRADALALLCKAKFVHKAPEYDCVPHLEGINLSQKEG